MIERTRTRITTEDKGTDPPEVYREKVTTVVKVFGVQVFKATDYYNCSKLVSLNSGITPVGYNR